MKTNQIFNILFCMTCMFIATSCEKAEIQKTGTLKHIEGRSCPITNCDECPDDDCCCAIELVNGSDVTLELCGTSSPNCLTTQTCYVDGLDPNCPDISGFLEYITLTAGSPRAKFCVPQNSPFGIVGPSTSTSTIRVHCQGAHPSPTWVTITLNTPPDKPYWETGTDCLLSPCL